MLNKEHALQIKFSGRVPWEAVSKQQRAALTCSSALLSPFPPAGSIPQLEISHAVTPQPGSDAAHTRMVCAQPGPQAMAARQTEEL